MFLAQMSSVILLWSRAHFRSTHMVRMMLFRVKSECRGSRTQFFSQLYCGHQLIHVNWIWLQSCLPLKLQKCFVDSAQPSISIVVSR